MMAMDGPDAAERGPCILAQGLCRNFTTYRRGDTLGQTLASLFRRQRVEVKAVDDVSFSLAHGEILGLLGPNGAGKSTTIKMLTGTLYPSSGRLEVLGQSPTKNRARYAARMGAVFGQKSQLIWDIPPIDSFRMNKAIYGIDDVDYKKRLGHMSELFELGDLAHKPTRVLSLGERMKCEFIMAMLHGPRIVFLDEPTIGLDVIAKQRIRDFIGEMNRQGTTFVLTTHDLEDVERLARSVIIINHGRKVFDGDLRQLRGLLGEKKIIRLSLARPAPEWCLAGTRVVERPSPLELVVEADLSKRPIGDILRDISMAQAIGDISIKELPMEEVITRIYSQPSAEQGST